MSAKTKPFETDFFSELSETGQMHHCAKVRARTEQIRERKGTFTKNGVQTIAVERSNEDRSNHEHH